MTITSPRHPPSDGRATLRTVDGPDDRPRRPIEDLVIARIRYVFWRAVTLLAFGTVYVAVVAEGFRILVPTLGQKLHRLPFLAFLRNYEDTHRIDLAIVMAMFLMFGVLFLWERLLDLFITQADHHRRSFDHFAKQSAENTFLFFAGILILGSDAILFYCAVNSMSWGGSALSFTAYVATAAYTSIILTIAHVTNKLRRAALPKE